MNKAVTGKDWESVNAWIDEPYAWIPGPKHRLLRHSPAEIFAKYGASEQALAGLTHIATDYAGSRNRKLKKVLEICGLFDSLPKGKPLTELSKERQMRFAVKALQELL